MKKTILLERGFTLMELLVVIAIMTILMAIVLPNLNNARVKGRDARRVADIKNIQLALAIYYDANRATGYPVSLEFLTPIYIPTIPRDPLGSDYAYSALGTGTKCSSYHLGATLEGAADQDGDVDDDGGNTSCEDDEGEEAEPDFDGRNTTCPGWSGGTGVQCYDVKP